MESTVPNSLLIFHPLLLRVKFLKAAKMHILSSLSFLASGYQNKQTTIRTKNRDCQRYMFILPYMFNFQKRARRTYASPYYQDST